MNRQEELMRAKVRKFVGAQNRLKACKQIVHSRGAAIMDRHGAREEVDAIEDEIGNLREELRNL